MKESGVLLHITSLASPHGIGTLGKAAMEFADFLTASGQTYWQILPVCPTGYGDSPYQSFSSFAGNPYLIDLDDLAERGLISRDEIDSVKWSSDPEKVDFGLMSRFRIDILKRAAEKLIGTDDPAFEKFCDDNKFWLDEYALFMCIKSHNNGISWDNWDDQLRNADRDALESFESSFSDELLEWKLIQYLFFSQWHRLKDYVNSRGIRIIGDMPIYVSLDSADVWAHPELFELDDNKKPEFISGCPPDGFSATGQLWGNPLFDWARMKRDGYRWWARRIDYLSHIYDVIRIDHFRGFESYFAIPAGDKDASRGKWRKGPGIELFRSVESMIGRKEIIAEDLGFLTQEVRDLLKESGYPGMKVLEMAFDHRDPAGSEYLPHNFIPHCVAYIGTHDNDTIMGWLENGPSEDTAEAKRYLGLNDPDNYNWDMMDVLWESDAGLTIVQAQDLLGLGSESRMNTPSVASGNWQWRALPGSFDNALADKILKKMQKSGRSCR